MSYQSLSLNIQSSCQIISGITYLFAYFHLQYSHLNNISSVAQSCPTLCDPINCSTPGLTVHHQLLEITQIYVHWLSDAIQPSHPLPSIFPSIRAFQMRQFFASGDQSISFSFTINPSNEYSGLISFRMDWLDLLAVQGTLKSLLQHHSSKASILGAQLSLWSNSYFHTWPLEKP